jgi:hypothetical protein
VVERDLARRMRTVRLRLQARLEHLSFASH